MADETDIPPLEDMTDLLDKVQLIKDQRDKRQNDKTNKVSLSNGHAESVKEISKETQNSTAKPPSLKKQEKELIKQAPEGKKTASGFGGMKKGFMFGGSSKPKKTAKEESIPYIKKNEEAMKIDEVQKAMNDTITSKKDEWLTDDLMNNIEKNEILMKKLQDPKFMEAVQMFQTNPTAAMERYKDDKETQDAFMQFCGLMGNHFSNLGEKSQKPDAQPKPSPKIQEIDPSDPTMYTPTGPPVASQGGTVLTRQSQNGADMSVRSSTNPKQATAEDETKMQEILSQPETMEVLMDPWVQNLLHVLRTDPGSGQRLLTEADNEKKKKIKKLVDVGLLQFQL